MSLDMRSISVMLGLALSHLLASMAFGQTRVEVYGIDVDDPVGKRLVYLVREEFRESSAFVLTSDDVPRIQLQIMTMPKEDDNPGISTIYSIVWVLAGFPDHGNLLANHMMGYAGSDVVEQSAEGIVAATDEFMSQWLAAAREVSE